MRQYCAQMSKCTTNMLVTTTVNTETPATLEKHYMHVFLNRKGVTLF